MKDNEFIQKIYTEKATNLLKICIGLSFFSLLTYLVGLFLYSSFDFGFLFEIISFIFIILAYHKLQKVNWEASKVNTIIAMIPIGWLLIYDLFFLLIHLKEVLLEVFTYYTTFDKYFYYLEPYLFDVVLVTLLVLLYKTHSSLCIADGTHKIHNDIHIFYDKQ